MKTSHKTEEYITTQKMNADEKRMPSALGLKATVLAVLFVIIGMSANAQLVHRYSFATDASDSVGSANGTLVSGTISSGLTTTGANNTDGVTLPTSAVAGITGPFTIETWFHANAPQGSWHTLFSFSDGTTANYVIGTPVRGDGGFDSSMAVAIGGTESLCKGGPEDSWNPPTDVRQMLLTYDGTTLTYYENGVAATVVNNLNRPGISLQAIATTSLGINGHSPWGDPSLNGTTRDFRIYNQYLTAAQVALLYARGYGASNASIAAALTPPVYSWKGNVNGIWDINTTANWYNSQNASSDVWTNLDVTLFDDTATTFLVTNSTTVYPVSLTVSNNIANYTFTGNGTISGVPLLKQGSGTVTIQSTNTFGGPSQIQNGTVVITAPNTIAGEGELWVGSTTNSGATLIVSNTTLNVSANFLGVGRGNGSSGYTSTLTVTNSTVNVGNFSAGWDGGFAGNNANQVINIFNSTFTDTGNYGMFFGESAGSTATALLAGNTVVNHTTGWTSVGASGTGTLTLQDSASLTNAGDFNVADIGASVGTLNLMGTPSLTANAMFIGSANGAGSTASGTVNQTNGAVTVLSAGDPALDIGGRVTGAAGVGIYNLFGGALNVNAGTAWVGGYGNGTMNVSGGSANFGSYLSIGRQAGSTGYLTVSGGTVNQINPSTILLVGELGTGTLTINNTGVVDCTNFISVGPNNTSVGYIYLNGGTLITTAVAGSGGGAGGGGLFYFNGGTLKAGPGAQTSFMHNMNIGANNDSAYISAGGARIDDGGQNLSFTTALIEDPSSTGGGLTKLGSGSLTLTNANTYTGPTVVSAGKLAITTASGTTGAYTVANSAESSLTVLAANAQVSPSSLTLGNSTLDFDLGGFGNPTLAPENVTGSLAVNGTVTINVADALPQVGSIPLITYGSKTGTGTFVLGSLPLGVVGNLTTVGNTLQLNITAVALPRWEGLAGGNWDVGVTTNWIDIGTGLPTKFSQGNAAVLDDRALGTTTLNLVTTVNPGSVIVSNTALPYTISGSGQIAGAAGLTKDGTNVLTISTANTYSGPTTLLNGTLVATTLANSGSGSSIGSSNLVFAGGALSYTGPNVTINRGYTVTGGGTLDLQSNLTLNGVVSATGGNFTKTGLGTLTYGGATTNNDLSEGGGAAAYVVAGGKVVFNGVSGLTNKVNGETWIGNGTGTTGEVDIINGAVFNSDDWFVIGVQGATGTFNVTNSTINHNVNGDFVVGTDNSSSVGLMNMVNSTLNQNVFNESIGIGGANGTLNQYGGTNFVAAQLNVGIQSGSTGSYNLNGGNVSEGNDLNIGVQGGTGSMVLSSNAVFNQTGGWSYIGGNFNSPHSGTATLTLQDNATMTTTGNLYVGFYGATAILNISNNATVNKNGGGVFDVGDNNGTVNQSGGTNTTGGELWIGDKGTGFYNLSGGVLNVNNNWLAVGRDSGTGTFTMTGGTINHTGGGNFTVGSFGTCNGTVNVSGGLINISGGQFYAGESSIGAVSISGTAQVSAPNGTTVGLNGGSTGTLNLNGGTLSTSQILGGGGSSTLNLNGTTTVATGNQSAFIGNLTALNVKTNGAIINDGGFSIGISQALTGDPSGDGGLTKLGNGRLNLNGVNTYTNKTIVTAGTLGGSGTIAGVVQVNSGASLSAGLGAANAALTLGKTPVLNGTVVANVSTNAGVLSADTLNVTAPLTYNGKLNIVNVGPNPLQVGETFTLFSAPSIGGSFSSITTTSPGQYVKWNVNTPAAGQFTVASVTSSAVPTITNSVSGNHLTLTWPAANTGWTLQVQTNSLSTGLGTNWVNVPGSTSVNTSGAITINPANGSVFYRLVYQP